MTANQISLSMCATCAHMGYDHDGPCTVTDQALGVAGKGFKPERAEGSIVGLCEFRKLRVVGISVDGVRL